MNGPHLVTFREATRRLGVSDSHLHREVKRGALPVVRVGQRAIRFDVADLAAYVEARRTTGTADDAATSDAPTAA